jgi:hypothetical protein
MRRRLATAVVAGMTLLTTLIGGPAAAEADPPGCPRGNFCIYPTADQRGAPEVVSEGNWEEPVGFSPIGASSVINNGMPLPGADHIQLDWIAANGQRASTCFHYNPGPGPGLYKANFAPGTIYLRAVWRGEC